MIKYKDFDGGESLMRPGMIMSVVGAVSIHP